MPVRNLLEFAKDSCDEICKYFGLIMWKNFPGDVHWVRLEASALGGLIAACPAWKSREEKVEESIQHR